MGDIDSATLFIVGYIVYNEILYLFFKFGFRTGFNNNFFCSLQTQHHFFAHFYIAKNTVLNE